MKNSASEQKNEIGGISVQKVTIPSVVILVILLMLVIVSIALTNYYSGKLSTTTQNYSHYITDANSLQAGSNLLSEMAGTFVLVPTTEAGYVNTTPLLTYANELSVDRSNKIVEKFRGYDVSKEAFEYILDAANCMNDMIEAQLHAIALLDAVYGLPDNNLILNQIPIMELPGRELDYTNTQKEAYAEVLVFGTEYSENKQGVSSNIDACVDILQKESAEKSANIDKVLTLLRFSMWILTIMIVFVFVMASVILYQKLVSPLNKFVHMIAAGSPLEEKKGLYEIRLLAHSYNALLARRDILEAGLRSAAETDALTKLPNRYRFKQYLLEPIETGHSIAFFVFDLNYLKITNDTKGHIAGDNLLCSAGECISECFGSIEDSICFRYGGDEFAAVLKDCTPEHIESLMEKFEQEQQRRNISIAAGYAYADDIRDTTLNKLFSEADKKMYANKVKMHKNINDVR